MRNLNEMAGRPAQLAYDRLTGNWPTPVCC